jgi:tetratricopeptide (TPR) repeat protein
MSKTIKTSLPIFFLIITLGLALFIQMDQIREYLNLNIASITALASSAGIESPIPVVPKQSELTEIKTCSLLWYLGFIAEQRGNREVRDQYWIEAVQCDPDLVRYLYNRYPDDMPLAQTIHAAQPESGSSWFWLGDLQAENRLAYYQHGLRLDPHDGRRWNTLGVMLEGEGDLVSAQEAYLQSCLNGDPGHNGCWRAGKTAEELGDYEAAIDYYRLSRWKPAFDRAKELEAQIAELKEQ